MSAREATFPALIRGLLVNAAYPHATDKIDCIETHISWVVLAGSFAYKIKKPLDLGFLDFSTLEQRRFYCEEELRLNRAWAPDIYLDVVGITLADGSPHIGAEGDAVEYAVKMRRFEQTLQLDRQLDDARLTIDDMRELGDNIASHHLAAATVPANQRERLLELTGTLMMDNLAALHGYAGESDLALLRDWTEKQLQLKCSSIGERFDKGFYRECHGDLHLANLVRLPEGITAFDCIEFDADLRHIDVACDVAFLAMDLESKGRVDLAACFLNRYLEKTDDYDSMHLFDMYFVYRCLVRAKVAAIRSGERSEVSDRTNDFDEAAHYVAMSLKRTAARRPILILMHGLSGSGKSWVAQRMVPLLPAIRVRSDLLRKRRFGLDETANSESDIAGGIYARAVDDDVYGELLQRASSILSAGHTVILDATYLLRHHREAALQMAQDFRAVVTIVRTTADYEELCRRIRERERTAKDPSEADLRVLEHQAGAIEPLTEDENRIACTLDSRDDCAFESCIAHIIGQAGLGAKLS
jgi:aminoglycoside phosphotransferase family enzyme/predicted kinase